MKLAAFAAALLAVSAHAADPVSTAAPGRPNAASAGSVTAVIPVKGMSCGGCVAHVDEELQKIAGVKSVQTSLDEARTTVVYDPTKVKPERIVKAIAAAGYEPGKPEVK